MRAVALVAGAVFRESVRDRVPYSMVMFAILLMAASYLMSQLTAGQDLKIIKDLGLAALSIFGLLIAVFLGIGLVSKEVERKSIFGLLAKPVTRTQFVLGKYAGLVATLVVNLGLMTLIVAEVALVTAIALFFSTFSSPLLAALLTLGLWVAGHFNSDLRNFGTVVDSAPIIAVARVLYYVLPNLAPFDVKAEVVHGLPVGLRHVGYTLLYAALYSSVLLTAAVVVFRRRDFK
jgi:Cu-processing system permease protein